MSLDRRPATYEQLAARLIAILTGDVLPLPDLFDLERWDQRIAIAVCEATEMTSELWDRLDYFSREPWIERTISLLTTVQPAPLIPEDAALLKVLLAAKGVTMIVEAISAKVAISDKTIRGRLRALHDLGLVEEPVKKKGVCLSKAGRARALELPADAGANLLRKP
jgi:hypothetical protein